MVASTITLCQSSIHKFITSIPSQASELAVNAVNNFIEDQVANPKTFERNISRVRHAFSRPQPPSPRHYGVNIVGGARCDGGGDCPQLETKVLLALPRKIRQNIWQFLDDKSVKTLRFVCHQLKREMDYDVGLYVVLTSASFNDPWIRSISIRSCTINEIDSLIQLNNLARPEKLEKLCFASELDIDPDMIELIIRKFRNLRQLVIFTEDVAVLKHVNEEAVSKGMSSKLFTRLEDQFQLTAIDVKFDTSKWKLKWNIKLKPQILDKFWDIQDVIGPFGLSGITRVPRGRDLSLRSLKVVTLSIPFVQDRDRYIWLRVLQSQNVLSSLTCDLNATHWKEYEMIIQSNCKSLQKIFLLNITSAPCARWKTDMPLDWKMFEKCVALEDITLIADTFMRTASTTIPSGSSRRYIDSINLSSLESCCTLRAVWMENFKITTEDMDFLKHSSSEESARGAAEEARYELCLLKNCLVDTEEVLETHIGSKKGRNRSLECLCFGTTSYDDDDLENFEKYTTSGQLFDSEKYTNCLSDWDMIEYFQNTCETFDRKETSLADILLGNVNLIGGAAFTAWMYWC